MDVNTRVMMRQLDFNDFGFSVPRSAGSRISLRRYTEGILKMCRRMRLKLVEQESIAYNTATQTEVCSQRDSSTTNTAMSRKLRKLKARASSLLKHVLWVLTASEKHCVARCVAEDFFPLECEPLVPVDVVMMRLLFGVFHGDPVRCRIFYELWRSGMDQSISVKIASIKKKQTDKVKDDVSRDDLARSLGGSDCVVDDYEPNYTRCDTTSISLPHPGEEECAFRSQDDFETWRKFEQISTRSPIVRECTSTADLSMFEMNGENHIICDPHDLQEEEETAQESNNERHTELAKMKNITRTNKTIRSLLETDEVQHVEILQSLVLIELDAGFEIDESSLIYCSSEKIREKVLAHKAFL